TSVEKREQKIDSLAHYKSSTIDYIKRKKGAIYLLDSNGKILDSINSTKSERKTMNQLELLKYSSKPWNYKREISVKILNKDRW
ncbi:sensor histidine kinase, partial [Staphylococcus aureus]|nr:sensor histidine kinase [Staphylococcus aureus]